MIDKPADLTFKIAEKEEVFRRLLTIFSKAVFSWMLCR